MSKNPHTIYTDVDINGNKLINAKVDNPSENNDIANKQYIDQTITLPNEGTYNPSVVVGGIDNTYDTRNKTVKQLLLDMLYPLVMPTYVEGKIIVLNTPIRHIIGINNMLTVDVDIDLGSRYEVVSNMTCIHKDVFNVQNITYAVIDGLKNIHCQFFNKAVDAESLTSFTLTCILSEAVTQLDSHGNAYIPPIFENNFTVSKVIDYIPILPVFYKMVALNENPNVNVLQNGMTWNQATTNLSYINDVTRYVETAYGFEVTIPIPATQPYDISLLIPNNVIKLSIDDDNIFNSLDTLEHNLSLPYTHAGVTQKYTGISFRTGDIKFDRPKELKILYQYPVGYKPSFMGSDAINADWDNTNW